MSLVLDDVYLTYGKGKKAVTALNGVTLRVEPETIYGLLGPSGCGKTTILACCLGIQLPRKGSVCILGQVPRSTGLGVPGPKVGYMPQHHTLHSYFTALEILTYYGRVFRVDDLEFKIRVLLQRLDLWDGKVERRQLTRLSGGQRRRVSLACAMIHQPKILVLDEPTVGVDPVLRQEIWKMLRDQTERGTTIMITTHYMEEASNADKVGFVRNGRVLKEDSPASLRESYDLNRLEDVFFKLCFEDSSDYEGSSSGNRSSQSNSEFTAAGEERPLLPYNEMDSVVIANDSSSKTHVQNSIKHMDAFRAVLFKNMKVLKRHRTFMVFQTFLPVVTLLMFTTCIGQPMRGLKLAFINEESDCQNRTNLTCVKAEMASLLSGEQSFATMGAELSCHIFDQLDSFVFAPAIYHDTFEDAKQSVVDGRSHGLVHVKEGFSEALTRRLAAILTESTISQEDLDLSEIKVRIDTTNYEIARAVQINLLKSVHAFFIDYAVGCNLTEISNSLFRFGIAFQTVQQLDGVEVTSNLSHAMLPAMTTLVLNLLAMALTADVLITEKEGGLLTRDFVCGISIVFVLLGQLLVFLIIAACQILFSVLLIIIVFPNLSLHVVIFLIVIFLLQAVSGMTLGLLFTAMFKDRGQVIQYGTAFVFPAFILSGIIWPRMTMPMVLQVLALALPSTITCDVSRAVVLNDSLQVPLVYLALLMPVLWSLFFFCCCIFIIRRWGFATPS